MYSLAVSLSCYTSVINIVGMTFLPQSIIVICTLSVCQYWAISNWPTTSQNTTLSRGLIMFAVSCPILAKFQSIFSYAVQFDGQYFDLSSWESFIHFSLIVYIYTGLDPNPIALWWFGYTPCFQISIDWTYSRALLPSWNQDQFWFSALKLYSNIVTKFGKLRFHLLCSLFLSCKVTEWNVM